MKLVSALSAAADLLLPRLCRVCGRELGRNERHICIDCLAGLPLTYHWNLPVNPMADRFNALISEQSRNPEKYAFALALFNFAKEGGYRHITYALKYEGNIAAGKFFSRMLAEKLSVAQSVWEQTPLAQPYFPIDAVVPVPLHWSRRLKRGYNQAEIIAAEISKTLGADLRTELLIRSRNTRTQTRLDVNTKVDNVRGAFSLKSGAQLHGLKHILLVDDVFTTGSTLINCFLPLRSAAGPDLRISIATLGMV